jgi:voltage-gated potassium channel Kch
VFPLIKAYRDFEGRFLLLFVLLALTVLASPKIADRRILVTIAFVAIPLAGIYASGYSRRRMIVAICIAIPAIATQIAANLAIGPVEETLASVSGAAFYGFTAVTVLEYVLRQKTVTPDTVYGALSVYLLLAFTWAFGYMTIGHITPGSFNVNTPYDVGDSLRRADYLYFSFVTLTTLGYGDIVPVTASARTVAITEAVCGVLFTTTLVASLVGRLITSRAEGD